ncbi:hypothetical protein ACFQZQ_03015 [Lysobacter koreensis]|uniref:Uncharacterized protein n=1 Tax=Lysobacter koreensis TaxID=266122 RepID=A0ABW2YIV6_9GAMM
MTEAEFDEVIAADFADARSINMFGSFKAWKASLPGREWVRAEMVTAERGPPGFKVPYAWQPEMAFGWHSRPR